MTQDAKVAYAACFLAPVIIILSKLVPRKIFLCSATAILSSMDQGQAGRRPSSLPFSLSVKNGTMQDGNNCRHTHTHMPHTHISRTKNKLPKQFYAATYSVIAGGVGRSCKSGVCLDQACPRITPELISGTKKSVLKLLNCGGKGPKMVYSGALRN